MKLPQKDTVITESMELYDSNQILVKSNKTRVINAF